MKKRVVETVEGVANDLMKGYGLKTPIDAYKLVEDFNVGMKTALVRGLQLGVIAR